MLVDLLRRRLNDPAAHSFQLMGEDLALLGNADLAAAVVEWERALMRLPEAVRAPFSAEQAALQGEAHAFLRKFNRSVHARLAGYVELGRRCQFRYPWPVVAILGIEQVLIGMGRNRVYGLVGELARRLGWRGLSTLSDGSEDVLRRTNRGIFADSIPTVLYALRIFALRRDGNHALGDALADGPLPPLMDEECRALIHGLAGGMAITDGRARFAALRELTVRHFAREQAIFTFHMGASLEAAPRGRPRSLLGRRLTALRSVPAPIVVHAGERRRVKLADAPLPRGFDMRDHAARVDAFGRAFVRSVTGDVEDYRAAVAHVLARWGRPGEAREAAALVL
jgi:hypothetical protein